MENYSIYDEIGRGTHSFVYKARRKRSIEFVAVKSTAKCRMDKILNEVQLLHKLDSRHVLKFYNWYESQNHIWLILEYCIGGDLLNLITQDKSLPEPAVQLFGSELVAGLQYLHAHGILFCDLKPASILIDEFGSLKLADFGLARRIPNHETLASASPQLAPGSPNYMAPELFHQPGIHSFASDFWALGCLLYELAVGRQPFTHTNFSELARMIQATALELPVPGCTMCPSFWTLLERLLEKDPFERMTWDELVAHPFWTGLPRLAAVAMPEQKLFDVAAATANTMTRRLSLESDATMTTNKTENDAVDKVAPSDHAKHSPITSTTLSTASVDRTNRDSSSSRSAAADDDDGKSSKSSDDDYNEDSGNDEAGDDADDADDDERLELLDQRSAALRPVSAPVQPSAFADRHTSTKPRRSHPVHSNHSTNNQDPSPTRESRKASKFNEQQQRGFRGNHDNDENKRSRPNNVRAPIAPRTAPSKPTASRTASTTSNRHRTIMHFDGPFDRDGRLGGALKKPSALIFTPADCAVKPIVCSDEIESIGVASVDVDALAFAPLVPEELLSCPTETLESHLKDIYLSLKASDASPVERCNVLAHLYTLCLHSKLANVVVNSSILALLARLLAGLAAAPTTQLPVSTQAVTAMLCLVLGVLFRFATFIAPSSPEQLQALVTTLTLVTRTAINNDEEGDVGDSHAAVASGITSAQLTRRRAAPCLGELLFYVSTQKEWTFPAAGLECIVEVLGTNTNTRTRDVVLCHYTVRTLCNMLVHCTDAPLQAMLVNERIARPLVALLVQLAAQCDTDDAADILSLRATTTQAISHVLRHLHSTPSSVRRRASAEQTTSSATTKSSRERLTLLQCTTAPSVLEALWLGVTHWTASTELAVASFNALSTVFDLKPARGTNTMDMSREQAALDANRTALFASNIVSFRVLAAMLATTSRFDDVVATDRHPNGAQTADTNATTAGHRRRYSLDTSSGGGAPSRLRAKAMLFLQLAMQTSTWFALQCIQQRHVDVVERVLQPFAAFLRTPSDSASNDNRSLSPSTNSADASSPSRSSSFATSNAHNSSRIKRRSSRSSAASTLPNAADTYVLQCALNLVRASIRLALKLSAECIAARDNDEAREDRAQSRATVSSASFELLDALLRNTLCRTQLVRYFIANDGHEFAFFVRLMAKLLVTFPTELLVRSDRDSNSDSIDTTTVAVCVSDILLRLFHGRVRDVAVLLAVENELLVTQLLPAVALQLHGGGDAISLTANGSSAHGHGDDNHLYTNCIRILSVALLQGDDADSAASDKTTATTAATARCDVFIKAHVLPSVCAVLHASSAHTNESVWQVTVELLDRLVARDALLVRELDAAGLVAPVLALLRAPKRLGVQSLPATATALVKRVVEAKATDALDELCASGVADALLAGLENAASESHGAQQCDLLATLYALLLSRYDTLRRAKAAQTPASPAPATFERLVRCAPLVVTLCASSQSQPSVSRKKQTTDRNGTASDQHTNDEVSNRSSNNEEHNDDATVTELASRCLMYLSQIFGDKLNDVVFARAAKHQRGSSDDDAVASSILSALEPPSSSSQLAPPDDIVVLRVLLTLKNCIRCQKSSHNNSNSVRIGRWLFEHVKLYKCVKGFARTTRATTAKASASSTTEQISKTASDIVRLCQSSTTSSSTSSTARSSTSSSKHY